MSAAGGRERSGLLNALLCAVVLAAGVGAILGVSAFLLVGLVVLALAAWDLAGFFRFLRVGGSDRREAGLLRRHLLFLLPAVVLGLLTAGAGLALSLHPPFAVMMGLVIADLLCLGLAARSLFDGGQEPPGETR